LPIARRFTDDEEFARAQTRRKLRENVPVSPSRSRQKDSPFRDETGWEWVSSYWRDLPSWTWPIDAYGAENSAAFAEKIRQRCILGREFTDSLLDGLAASLSLTLDEKLKVFDDLATLSREAVQKLARIFTEEQSKFAALVRGEQTMS